MQDKEQMQDKVQTQDKEQKSKPAFENAAFAALFLTVLAVCFLWGGARLLAFAVSGRQVNNAGAAGSEVALGAGDTLPVGETLSAGNAPLSAGLRFLPSETTFTSVFPLKFAFLEANGAISRFLGQREMNDVLRLSNDFITLRFAQVPEETLTAEAEAVVSFADALSARDIPFLYVLPPERVLTESEAYPRGYESFENENTVRYLSVLSANDVSLLSLEEEFADDGLSREEIFYRTDHHWNIDGAFYCAGKILDWLDEEDFPTDSALRDPVNYERLLWEDSFIGSYAQRTGVSFAGGRDDFSVLVPKFPTAFSDLVTGVRGDFTDVFLHLEEAGIRDYEVTTYAKVFAEGVHLYDNDNLDKDEGISLLFIHDSYGYPVIPYLAVSLNTVHLASAYDLEAVTDRVLSEIRPDAVVMMKYPPFHLGHDEYFQVGIE